jgi:hypothetical protein
MAVTFIGRVLRWVAEANMGAGRRHSAGPVGHARANRVLPIDRRRRAHLCQMIVRFTPYWPMAKR